MPSVRRDLVGVGATWEAVLDRMRLQLELDDVEPDEPIDTSDGATGVIEACTDGTLAFTWKEPDWRAPSHVTLQLAGGQLSVVHDGIPAASLAWYDAFWQDELAVMAG